MSSKRVYYSYYSILKNMVQYMPSRVIIILNSFFIVPLFAHFLSTKQISIYLLSLQILNFICTCSYDWISKSVLRFYDKYLLEKRIQNFFITTLWISILTYITIILAFFVGRNFVIEHFAFNNYTLALIIILVIPCGIRQFLYQILRAKNYYKLYTLSIIIYQVLLVAIFLMFASNFPYATTILLAMIVTISIIDIFIISQLNLNYKITCSFDWQIGFLILKYALPIVITNACYWGIFYVPMLLFQNFAQYLNAAIFGIARTFASNVVTPLANMFIFVSFPVIMRLFEHNKNIKLYITNLVKIYLFILFPIVSCICFFSKDILGLILPVKYDMVANILPIMVISLFLHELMKIINLKYHVKIKTHIEFFFGLIIMAFAILAYNWGVEQKLSIIILTCIMMFADMSLLLINLFINFEKLSAIKVRDIMETAMPLLLISGLVFGIVSLIQFPQFVIVTIIKIILFLILSYTLGYILRHKILH